MTLVEPDLIVVSIRAHGEAKLKVVWSKADAAFEPYLIDRGLITRTAERIRNTLTGMVTRSMQQGVRECAPGLFELATHGYRLYQALFSADSGDARIIQEWLSQLTTPHRITFQVDDRIHVPWGLIFGSEPTISRSDPKNIKIESFDKFWCLKYLVSCVYFRITPRGADLPRNLNTFHVFSVINPSALEQAKTHLRKHEGDFLDSLFIKFGDPIHSSDECVLRWKAASSRIGLAHFYCHANGTSLALSAEDLLSIDEFRLDLKKEGGSAIDNPCVVFLNGCSTAVGDPDGGFLEITGRNGFCGFIGTECKVPDVFALRFGLDFINIFLSSGKPLYEVMAILRKKNWPLSLIYGLYSHPLLRVEPQHSYTILSDNCSEGPLGSKVM
jgi:hypothetical protein